MMIVNCVEDVYSVMLFNEVHICLSQVKVIFAIISNRKNKLLDFFTFGLLFSSN